MVTLSRPPHQSKSNATGKIVTTPWMTPPLVARSVSAPPVGRRLLAWLVDFGIVVAIAGLLAFVTYLRISALLSVLPAGASSVSGLLGSHGHVTARGVQIGVHVGLSLWHHAALYALEAFALLIVFTFAYQFSTLAWRGRTLGKTLLDLRVGPKASGVLTHKQAAIRAAATTVFDVGLFTVACCLLMEGSFVLAVFAWLVAVFVFWVNVAVTLVGRRRSLSDRIAGTCVVTGRMYAEAARVATQGGQLATHGAHVAVTQAKRVADSEQFHHAQVVAADSARRLAALGRSGTRKSVAGIGRARDAYKGRRSLTSPSPPPVMPHPRDLDDI